MTMKRWSMLVVAWFWRLWYLLRSLSVFVKRRPDLPVSTSNPEQLEKGLRHPSGGKLPESSSKDRLAHPPPAKEGSEPIPQSTSFLQTIQLKLDCASTHLQTSSTDTKRTPEFLPHPTTRSKDKTSSRNTTGGGGKRHKRSRESADRRRQRRHGTFPNFTPPPDIYIEDWSSSLDDVATWVPPAEQSPHFLGFHGGQHSETAGDSDAKLTVPPGVPCVIITPSTPTEESTSLFNATTVGPRSARTVIPLCREGSAPLREEDISRSLNGEEEIGNGLVERSSAGEWYEGNSSVNSSRRRTKRMSSLPPPSETRDAKINFIFLPSCGGQEETTTPSDQPDVNTSILDCALAQPVSPDTSSQNHDDAPIPAVKAPTKEGFAFSDSLADIAFGPKPNPILVGEKFESRATINDSAVSAPFHPTSNSTPRLRSTSLSTPFPPSPHPHDDDDTTHFNLRRPMSLNDSTFLGSHHRFHELLFGSPEQQYQQHPERRSVLPYPEVFDLDEYYADLRASMVAYTRLSLNLGDVSLGEEYSRLVFETQPSPEKAVWGASGDGGGADDVDEDGEDEDEDEEGQEKEVRDGTTPPTLKRFSFTAPSPAGMGKEVGKHWRGAPLPVFPPLPFDEPAPSLHPTTSSTPEKGAMWAEAISGVDLSALGVIIPPLSLPSESLDSPASKLPTTVPVAAITTTATPTADEGMLDTPGSAQDGHEANPGSPTPKPAISAEKDWKNLSLRSPRSWWSTSASSAGASWSGFRYPKPPPSTPVEVESPDVFTSGDGQLPLTEGSGGVGREKAVVVEEDSFAASLFNEHGFTTSEDEEDEEDRRVQGGDRSGYASSLHQASPSPTASPSPNLTEAALTRATKSSSALARSRAPLEESRDSDSQTQRYRDMYRHAAYSRPSPPLAQGSTFIIPSSVSMGRVVPPLSRDSSPTLQQEKGKSMVRSVSWNPRGRTVVGGKVEGGGRGEVKAPEVEEAGGPSMEEFSRFLFEAPPSSTRSPSQNNIPGEASSAHATAWRPGENENSEGAETHAKNRSLGGNHTRRVEGRRVGAPPKPIYQVPRPPLRVVNRTSGANSGSGSFSHFGLRLSDAGREGDGVGGDDQEGDASKTGTPGGAEDEPQGKKGKRKSTSSVSSLILGRGGTPRKWRKGGDGTFGEASGGATPAKKFVGGAKENLNRSEGVSSIRRRLNTLRGRRETAISTTTRSSRVPPPTFRDSGDSLASTQRSWYHRRQSSEAGGALTHDGPRGLKSEVLLREVNRQQEQRKVGVWSLSETMNTMNLTTNLTAAMVGDEEEEEEDGGSYVNGMRVSKPWERPGYARDEEVSLDRTFGLSLLDPLPPSHGPSDSETSFEG